MLEKFEKIREFSPEFFRCKFGRGLFLLLRLSLRSRKGIPFTYLREVPNGKKSTLMKRLSEKLYGKGEVPELFIALPIPIHSTP